MLVALSLLALAPLAPLALASSCTFQEGAAGSLRVEFQRTSRGKIKRLTALDVKLESPSSVVEKACWEEMRREEEGEDYTILSLEVEELEPGTDYSIRVIYSHQGEEVGVHEEPFTTLLDLSTLHPNVSVVGEEVVLEWEEVEGATTYLVYRQYEGEERDNSSVAMVATSGATGVVVAGQAPCSTATYHVQPATATLGEQEMVATAPATVLTNDTVPYVAEELEVVAEGAGVEVGWRHLPCLEHYTALFTDSQGSEVQKEVEATPGEARVQVVAGEGELEECTVYSLSIVPRFVGGEVWEARPEVQERVRVRREEECEAIAKEARRRSLEASRKARRRASGAGGRSGDWVLLVVVALVVGW